MPCIFKHHVDCLFGVQPQPISGLPKVCTCGAEITYADTVIFVSQPKVVEPGTLEIEECGVTHETAVPNIDPKWNF